MTEAEYLANYDPKAFKAQLQLQEKTAVVPPYIEQLCTVGNSHRDVRGWSVTVCYTALMSYQACETQIDSVSDVKWWPLEDVLQMPLAFDHLQLIEQARERLTQKALYSLVPGFALAEPFTLPELQHVHEQFIPFEVGYGIVSILKKSRMLVKVFAA